MLYNVLLYLRCLAETAKINLMVFVIHVVLHSGEGINNIIKALKREGEGLIESIVYHCQY